MISFSHQHRTDRDQRIEEKADLAIVNMQSLKLPNFGDVEIPSSHGKRLQDFSLQDTVYVFRKGSRLLVIKSGQREGENSASA